MYKRLFEPVRIGRLEVKNRLAMAAMNNRSQFSFTEGALNERCVEYYKERCRGGVGLVITGVFKVENEIEKETWPILTEKGVTPLGEIVDFAHACGTKVVIQLSAGAGRNIRGSREAVCSSPVPAFFWPEVTCRELTTAEVERIVEAFGKATALTLAAGVDGIEVHGHEGYLLDQFTTSYFNQRTDQYGGDFQGRLRFSLEILKIIRKVAGPDFPVIYRFGAKHFIKRFGQGILAPGDDREAGRDVPEGLEIAKWLESVGYDALDVDAGLYESLYWAHPPIYQPHGCYVEFAKVVKQQVKIPVIVAGRLGVPDLANQVVKEGKADIIALGRDLLADPYWPAKVKAGQGKDIRPCIGCHKGCLERARTRVLSCSVNPSCGREIFQEMKKTEKAKKILIAGGGLAGMEAARASALRGHDVYLLEKSDRLGGHLISGSVPQFKSDIQRLLDWYKRQLKTLHVKVQLKKAVNSSLVKKLKPDILIVAIGSTPMIPAIPGIKNSNVATCVDLLLGKAKLGKQVVIIGGGLVGCETALWMAGKGAQVTIVEMLPEIALDYFTANRNMILELLSKAGVKVFTNTRVQEIADGKIMGVADQSRPMVLSCDQVALAVGQSPRKELFSSLANEFPEIYEIGDCQEPRNIHFAIWEGYAIGCKI